MLFPYTIPKGCPSDIACEVTEQGPVKLHRIYIENGVAKVATSYSTGRFPAWMVSRHLKWTEQFTIGNAEAVAIEFDGRWHRVGGRWELITTGEPYYFWVDGGKLSVQQGQGPTYELAPSGVTKVAALRGWKNTFLWNHDQGIICAYIRAGDLYYRNFANQGTDADPLPAIWDTERKVDELSPAQDVALFRTNDYRTGFLAERSGEIHWAITSRNWAVMALEPHTITAGIDVAVDLIPITYADIYHEHTITAGITVAVQMLYGASYNAFTLAANDDNETVRATVEHLLTDPDPLEFVIIDENEDAFDCLDVEIDPLDPLTLIITVQDLNYSAEGDLTLKFLGSVTAKGEAGQTFDPFDITFTPEGLDYVAVSGPEVEAMWNE